jgi:DNA-binding NarL/FixJ family response regulator
MSLRLRDARVMADILVGRPQTEIAAELGICNQRVTQIKQSVKQALCIRDDCPPAAARAALRQATHPDRRCWDSSTPEGFYHLREYDHA